jgi:hypothetical protein
MMMRQSTRQTVLRTALSAILLAGVAAPAQAQFGDLRAKAQREAERRAAAEAQALLESTESQNASSSSTAASASTAPSGSGAPKPTSITQCDGTRPSKITYGRLGEYTFSQGMSTETRTGFVDRRDVSFESGCILPNLTSGDVMYLEYDTTTLRGMGYPNDFETQCIKIDDRPYGAVNVAEGRSEYPSNDSYLGDSHLRLACGNSVGISECTNGRNSDRASEASADLSQRGVKALSFFMTRTRSSATPRPGERLYCQFYNKTSGKSLFGYEYFREYG